jgi:hypothetical protein
MKTINVKKPSMMGTMGVIAMLAIMTLTAVADAKNGIPQESTSFRCAPSNSMPSTQYKPGSIIVASRDVGLFPLKNDLPIYSQKFERKFMTVDGKPLKTADNEGYFNDFRGMTFSSTAKPKAALTLIMDEQSIQGVKARASATADWNRTMTIKGRVPNHWGYIIPEDELENVQEWFDTKRPDKKNRPGSYYVINEVRVAEELTFSIEKTQFLQAGIDVSVDKIGSLKPGVTLDSSGNFALSEKQERPMVFCFRYHPLNPIIK